MKTASLKLGFLSLVTAILIFSCKKETSEKDLSSQEQEQAAIATSEADAESEAIFNDVFDNVIGVNSEVGLEGTGIFGRMNPTTSNETQRITGCFTVTTTRLVTGKLFPVRIEIDFGAGCTGRDGKTRAGKIITEYTGRLIVPGKSATTTFSAYKVNGLSIEGTVTITNTSTTGNRQFTVDVTGAKITKVNGNYIKWNAKRVITQTEGLATPELHQDDVFSVTGQANGEVKKDGFVTTWESIIKEPLVKKFSCPWVSKGVLTVSRSGLSSDSKWVAKLSYGTGDCDNKAILTLNGIERQITLN